MSHALTPLLERIRDRISDPITWTRPTDIFPCSSVNTAIIFEANLEESGQIRKLLAKLSKELAVPALNRLDRYHHEQALRLIETAIERCKA